MRAGRYVSRNGNIHGAGEASASGLAMQGPA
jgi:hypothetical protein